MSDYSVALSGGELAALLKELERLSALDLREVERQSALDLYTRAQQDGGTPVGDYSRSGQLRGSAAYAGGEMGYTAEYAPHVEYGHRQQVGRFVPAIGKKLVKAFVPGQYFLKANVDKQAPITRQYALDALQGKGR